MQRFSVLTALMIGILVLGVYPAAYADFEATDPTGLDSAINTKGFTMSQEVGNTNLAQFNSHSRRKVFTFDPDDGYGYDGSAGETHTLNPGKVVLTKSASSVNLTTSITASGASGFGIWIDDDSDQFLSSDPGRLAISVKTLTIDFDHPVLGVGFTINDARSDLSISLYDSDDNLIGSAFTFNSNGESGNSHHGFFGQSFQRPQISRVVIMKNDDDTNQYGLDDLAVLVPEPGSLSLITVGGLLMLNRKRRNYSQ